MSKVEAMSKLEDWWNGKIGINGEPITYANYDGTSPKECFNVILFFVIPWFVILIALWSKNK